MTTVDYINDLRLTRPLVKEGAKQRQDRTFEKTISGQESQIGLDTKTS
jgi:hypothetical protein